MATPHLSVEKREQTGAASLWHWAAMMTGIALGSTPALDATRWFTLQRLHAPGMIGSRGDLARDCHGHLPDYTLADEV
jgi:hypothetical protein